MSSKIIKPPNTIYVELTSYGSLNVISAPVRLHKDSYNVTVIACGVPKTINSTNAPLCKVFSTSIDNSGQIVMSQPYNLPQEEEDVEKNGFMYRVFSATLPPEFCFVTGQLTLTFNYFDTDGNGNATTILTSGSFNTYVDGAGANMNSVIISNYDATAAKVNEHSVKLSKIVAKSLVDITVDNITGEGWRYYSDGTSAKIQFPVDSASDADIRSDWIRILTFVKASFVPDTSEPGAFVLAFGPGQTGFSDNDYMALLDRTDSKIYETGNETTSVNHDGYTQLDNSFFKGSDGSILLHGINEPFDGRMVLLSGGAFSGRIVGDVQLINDEIVITYIDKTTESLPLTNFVTRTEFDGLTGSVGTAENEINNILELLKWKTIV